MRGRSSSKQGKICSSRVAGVSMEKHKADKVKEEPHLSGAYIRSLVKHLTSIKTKDSFNEDGGGLPETINSNGECLNDHNNMQQESPPSPPPPPPPPPPKKQVRRRQHTSKPYQERLLNMAEARREIVTALKFHRASMKQQKVAHDNHDIQLDVPSYPPPPQEVKSKSKRNSRAYPSSTTTAAANTSTTSLSNNCIEHYSGYWPISTISPPPLPPLYHENVNFQLPNQTLGLNLNFQDFQNLDANLYSSSSSSSSSQSTSSSAAISIATEEMAASVPEEVVASSTTTSSSGVIQNDLHHAMDDEEMEEIRSLGEQLQMEWNDTMNLAMSARWFEFLKTFEFEPEDGNIDNLGFNPYDQAMEFPPCMDNGEIEGMDGEWLA